MKSSFIHFLTIHLLTINLIPSINGKDALTLGQIYIIVPNIAFQHTFFLACHQDAMHGQSLTLVSTLVVVFSLFK